MRRVSDCDGTPRSARSRAYLTAANCLFSQQPPRELLRLMLYKHGAGNGNPFRGKHIIAHSGFACGF